MLCAARNLRPKQQTIQTVFELGQMHRGDFSVVVGWAFFANSKRAYVVQTILIFIRHRVYPGGLQASALLQGASGLDDLKRMKISSAKAWFPPG